MIETEIRNHRKLKFATGLIDTRNNDTEKLKFATGLIDTRNNDTEIRNGVDRDRSSQRNTTPKFATGVIVIETRKVDRDRRNATRKFATGLIVTETRNATQCRNSQRG
ncbi:MAG: hypothetical protein AB8H86_28020 [Polyangiales bacterium]